LVALKVEFLGLILLIVYVGAISILFLFVIMMFNLKELALAALKKKSQNKLNMFLVLVVFLPIVKFYFIIEKYLTFVVINKILLSPLFILKGLKISTFVNYEFNDIYIFSNLLYTYYSFLFILSSFILFAAMIGAIILALSTIEELGPKV
jgi:NADH:ubiquinone oxidoreductase subunit 6 (subunit J)